MKKEDLNNNENNYSKPFCKLRNTSSNLLKEKYGFVNNKNRIEIDKENEYINRLKKEYIKGGKIYSYYKQFEKGQGKELRDKFWSPASSSRYAFEMYSWLANYEFCENIEFEFFFTTNLRWFRKKN